MSERALLLIVMCVMFGMALMHSILGSHISSAIYMVTGTWCGLETRKIEP